MRCKIILLRVFTQTLECARSEAGADPSRALCRRVCESEPQWGVLSQVVENGAGGGRTDMQHTEGQSWFMYEENFFDCCIDSISSINQYE